MKQLELEEKPSTAGLRIPSEVVSTHYILRTEQSQLYVKISKIISSVFMIIAHICLLIISSFLIFWWGISYPKITIKLWYYLLSSLIYSFLFIEIVLRWYAHYMNLKLDILSILLWIASLIFISISTFLPKKTGYFIGAASQIFLFIIIILNITRGILLKRLSRTEENDAQKIMDIYDFPEKEEYNDNKDIKLTERDDKGIFNEKINNE